MKRLMFLTIAFIMVALLGLGCSIPTGHLTAISTRALNTPIQKGIKVKGKDCNNLLFGIIPITSTFIPNYERATENALSQGGGDILVDVKAYRTLLILPLILTRICEVVEGTSATMGQ
jgi:hypothetical protein